MFDFQQKRKIKKIIYSKITLFVLFILVILIGRSTYSIYNKEKLSEDNYKSIKKDYEDLYSRNLMLSEEISRLKTEEGVEEDIRNKFSVAKPGETVVVIVDSSSSTSTDVSESKTSIWSRFIGWFQ